MTRGTPGGGAVWGGYGVRLQATQRLCLRTAIEPNCVQTWNCHGRQV